MRRGGGATERTAPVRVKVFVGAVPEADDEGSRADASSAHEVSFNVSHAHVCIRIIEWPVMKGA